MSDKPYKAFNVTAIEGDDDDATITVEQVAIPAPSRWCKDCGVVVHDMKVHDRWHEKGH